MANYSSTIISLFFWIIIIFIIFYILYKITKCLFFEIEPVNPEDIVFEPEVQMVDNIAGQEVVINGFVN